jgi:hypothetical protein
MVSHPLDCFSPFPGHVAFTSPVRRARTLSGHRLIAQEGLMSPYARNCTLGGLVALLTGFLTGFLTA